MITESERKEVMDWINESEDTNYYCERSLIFDAFLSLNKDIPDIENAKRRLRELLPITQYHLIKPPDFVKS